MATATLTKTRKKPKGSAREYRLSGMLDKVLKAVAKPGISKASVFGSGPARRVYAYSVYSKDPTLLVREDVDGNKVLGRIVSGRFRVIRGH
jgi:hypothetical protein